MLSNAVTVFSHTITFLYTFSCDEFCFLPVLFDRSLYLFFPLYFIGTRGIINVGCECVWKGFDRILNLSDWMNNARHNSVRFFEISHFIYSGGARSRNLGWAFEGQHAFWGGKIEFHEISPPLVAKIFDPLDFFPYIFFRNFFPDISNFFPDI